MKQMAEKTKRERGRPELFSEGLMDTVVKLVQKGLTIAQIAKKIGVSEFSLYAWQKKYPDFSKAVKDAREMADEFVEASLFHRATGYSHPEVKVFYDAKSGECVEHEVVKHYPPDPTSMIFWLKNRQPEKWRDKLDVDANVNAKVTDESIDKMVNLLSTILNEKEVIDITPIKLADNDKAQADRSLSDASENGEDDSSGL